MIIRCTSSGTVAIRLSARSTGNADGQIWDEPTVHHVDVDEVRPATLDCGNLVGEVREVGRNNGGSDPKIHRLTSSEMASPGAIWKPACGRLSKDNTRRQPGIRMFANDGDPEPARPEHVSGRYAIDADQIGHHICAATLSPVDQKGNGLTVSRRRGLLRNHGTGRIAIGLDLRQPLKRECALLQAPPGGALRGSNQCRHRARCLTGAQPELDAAAAACGEPGTRILVRDASCLNCLVNPA